MPFGIMVELVSMTEVSQKTTCNQCNSVLDESSSLLEAERNPCPKCGSISRAFQINVSDTVEIYPFLKLHHKVPGRKNPIAEITSGYDLHRDSGVWMFLERVIDRGKNWYKEIITNIKTNEVIHYTEHPLNQHTGHGSDKKKRGSI